MLKKNNRLAKSKDIKTAFARGRTFFNPYFSIKYSPSTVSSKRFAIVVANKVFKKAVARNRLKRIIREFLRKNLALFKNGDHIIVTKPRVSSVSEQVAFDNFTSLVKQMIGKR